MILLDLYTKRLALEKLLRYCLALWKDLPLSTGVASSIAILNPPIFCSLTLKER
jgi:hypothetical protein